jgi:hypothetical protein
MGVRQSIWYLCASVVIGVFLALMSGGVFLALMSGSVSTVVAMQEATVVIPGDQIGNGPEEAEDNSTAIANLTEEQLAVIAIFALTILLMFLAFLYVVGRSQGYAYWVLHRLSLKGLSVRIDHVAVLTASDRQGIMEGEQSEVTFTVSVPKRLTIGERASATVEVTGLNPYEVEWGVSDPSVQIIREGQNAYLTASKAGRYTLSAKLVGHPELDKEIEIEVIEKEGQGDNAVPIPFLGAGIATLGIVFTLLLLLAILGVTGVLTGDQLLPVITAIVGGFIGAGAAVLVKDKEGS